jgi:hypothetical protein
MTTEDLEALRNDDQGSEVQKEPQKEIAKPGAKKVGRLELW